MKKRISALLAGLGLIIVLTSCHGGEPLPGTSAAPSAVPSPSQLPATSAPPVQASPPSPAGTPPLETDLDKLRQDANGLCSVVYIGYVEENNEDTIRKTVTENGYGSRFSFLDEFPSEQIVIAVGCDLYCIVPGDKTAQVNVRLIEYDTNGAEVLGEPVYAGGGDPFLLLCNVSDIMPNSLVTIQTGTEALSFSPYISLKDGFLATTAPEDMIYDFTPLLWALDPDAAAYYDLFMADPGLVILLSLAPPGERGFTDDQLSAYALTVLAVQGKYDYETGLSMEDMNAVSQKHFGRDIERFENSMTTILASGRVTATVWSFDSSVFLVLDGQPQEQDGVIIARFKCYWLSDTVWLDQEIAQNKLDHIREYLLTGNDEDFPAPLPLELAFEQRMDHGSQTEYVFYHDMALWDGPFI